MGEGLGQSGDDGVDLGFGEGVVEGEGDRALGDGLGDGEGAAQVPEALPDVITDDTDFGISRMGEDWVRAVTTASTWASVRRCGKGGRPCVGRRTR